MIKIALGYGTGLAATLKTIQLIAQTSRALEKAKADADIDQIRADIAQYKRRERQTIRMPTPPRMPNPALDNWILKTKLGPASRYDPRLRNPLKM